jgi:glutamate synthase domain-containing protein 2
MILIARRTTAIARRSVTLRASIVLPTRLVHNGDKTKDLWDQTRVTSYVGHQFPDFIEHWNRTTFRQVGYGMVGLTVGLGVLFPWTVAVPAALATAGYWMVGLQDISQTSHAIRRNYPVLGNIRYILETIRPEIHQYMVESDQEGVPFHRLDRAQVYQRAKHVNDTLAFGTRRNVYDTRYEWACHSMWPKDLEHNEQAKRWTIGCHDYGTTQPYSCSVLNISAMSFGAISENAILALNAGAKMGGFYHNTGEGGVSRYHREAGGDLVWNIGTGYFGCGSNGHNGERIFEPTMFQETIDECGGQIKMLEVKLSQGAKPGHGGLLPRAKITPEIAAARKLEYPPTHDCHSPANHAAFSTPHQLVEFLGQLRQLSRGLPVGIKLCVGQPGEFAALCKAMVEVGTGPDFITVDGAEGGTGAAPPELTNSVGLPMQEGLVLVRNFLVGAGLRDKISIVAAGKISSGFSIIRTVALGAHVTCAARAFMLSLGCIQSLKCNTNKCPTGIATQRNDLMYGLDSDEKKHRVYHFHKSTVEAAAGIAGIMGYDSISSVTANDVMRRVSPNVVQTLSEAFPEVEPGCLLTGSASPRLQIVWDECLSKTHVSTRRWIY